MDPGQCAWVAAAAAGGASLLSAVIILPVLKRRFAKNLKRCVG
jgi:uncharacterized membrane protein